MRKMPLLEQQPYAGEYHRGLSYQLERIYQLIEENDKELKPSARLIMKMNALYSAACLGLSWESKEVQRFAPDETLHMFFDMAVLMHRAGLSPVEEKQYSNAKAVLMKYFSRYKND